MGPSPHVWFLDAKQRLMDRNNKALWVQGITCLLCMQNSVICTRMTSLYGFQASSVLFFSSKTAPLWPDLQVCMGPRPHLWFWAHITACLAQEYRDYMGSSPRLWFCACKTATLAHELLVSICPSLHLMFLHANQRLLGQKCMSLWDPDLSCRFVHAKRRD